MKWWVWDLYKDGALGCYKSLKEARRNHSLTRASRIWYGYMREYRKSNNTCTRSVFVASEKALAKHNPKMLIKLKKTTQREGGLLMLNIELKRETEKELKRICKPMKIKPEELLIAFIQDLTGTPGSGSDERMFANQWFERHLYGSEFIY